MKVTVIISFYNKIDVLKLLIAGFERQSFEDFEIIVADDGSKKEVVKELNMLIATSGIQIRHVWHDDNGWRKNTILNKAILESSGDYLIFVDGDCIPHRHFVADHYRNRRAGTLLTGRRVKLSEKISQRLTIAKVKSGYLDRRPFGEVVWDSLFGKSKHIEKGFRLFGLLKQTYPRKNKNREVLGCNFSLSKADFLSINGFDERYLGPGIGEDNDIDLRFTNHGGKVMFFKLGAIQYHVYHRVISRYDRSNNLRIFNENKKMNLGPTKYGIKSTN
ncbi:MAG: glycosyltransferase [Cyclobacteriaceae bacterium]